MNDRVQVGDRWIGTGHPTFIIAEAGSNHDGDWKQALQLIEIAADSGADAIKFQLYLARDLYSPGTEAYEMVQATELQKAWIPELASYSKNRGLMFLVTPFGRWAVDYLAEQNVPAYKWASSEAVNLPLLKYAAGKKKPIFLSTGMCDLADVYEAIAVIQSAGNEDIVLMQCASLYPTLPRFANLRVMDSLRASFGRPVGFSDHTLGPVIPVAAVARGACVIEKHFTPDRALPGPDHGYAMEPLELRRMIEAIRAVEESLGSSIKVMVPEEAEVARRESIRAARDLVEGEVIAPCDVVLQRPGIGVRPRFLGVMVGHQLRRSIPKGGIIEWNNLEPAGEIK